MSDILAGSDLIRWVALVEMLALLSSGFLVQGRYSRGLPSEVRWMLRGLLSLALVLAIAVTVNAFAGPMPTPGVYIAAIGALPASALGAFLGIHVLRESRRMRFALLRESVEIMAWIDRMEHLEPCPDPGCVRARAEIRVIATRLGA